MWRGSAIDGATPIHRQRWIQMMNPKSNSAFRPTLQGIDDTKLKEETMRQEWLDTFANVKLQCSAAEKHWYRPFAQRKGCVSKEEMYACKFLPSIDGESFSTRIRSTTLALRATIYTECYGDRLVPWAHYVPFDNTFSDIFAVMNYFLENDKDAERIATEGREWVGRVMRREDAVSYVWRLLLEYARVVDKNRDLLGYVEDLI